jgi:hypothetical protein
MLLGQKLHVTPSFIILPNQRRRNQCWFHINFWTYQQVLVLGTFLKNSYQPRYWFLRTFKKKLSYQPGLGIWFKTDFGLVCGRYIPGIEIGIKLVHSWYYLRYLAGSYCFRSCRHRRVLAIVLILLLILGTHLYTKPTLQKRTDKKPFIV